MLAAREQLPEDVGKSGPLGLLLTVLLLIAVALLVRSMTKHLKRIPASFDPSTTRTGCRTPPPSCSTTPRPGDELLDTLRRAPRAIEPPRRDDAGASTAATDARRRPRPMTGDGVRPSLPGVRHVDHEPRRVVRLPACRPG